MTADTDPSTLCQPENSHFECSSSKEIKDTGEISNQYSEERNIKPLNSKKSKDKNKGKELVISANDVIDEMRGKSDVDYLPDDKEGTTAMLASSKIDGAFSSSILNEPSNFTVSNMCAYILVPQYL